MTSMCVNFSQLCNVRQNAGCDEDGAEGNTSCFLSVSFFGTRGYRTSTTPRRGASMWSKKVKKKKKSRVKNVYLKALRTMSTNA